jgi:glycosyltransferase involved in cell wall biosynthesis
MVKKLFVLTVGHPRYDTRIWVKEISTLIAAGFVVEYCVADGLGDEIKNGVIIRDFGRIEEGGGAFRRFKTMLVSSMRCEAKRGDWIYFHDGIFLPFALILACSGRRIIYDVHEDFPRQILNNRFPKWFKILWSALISLMEACSGYFFKGFVAATPCIAKRFPSNKTITVSNFPLLEEFGENYISQRDNDDACYGVYIGMLSEVRGLFEMIQAMGKINHKRDATLRLAGRFSPPSLESQIQEVDGWDNVEYLGWIDRRGVVEQLREARFGLVVLHPVVNYIDAYPVKLFEYMAAGVPVIASDFPLWREIVEKAGCGLMVDPLDHCSIADAIQCLCEDQNAARTMGLKGQEAVRAKYNWENEGEKLVNFLCSIGAGST